MTLLIKPTLACNLSCAYCYQNRLLRKKDYDLDWILKTIEELVKTGQYTGDLGVLHGGEPLTLPKEDIEAIFKKIVELGLRPSIQTNGTLIDDDIIDLFKRYRVSVGVSIDGPGKLNILRAPPSVTERILENIRRLVDEKISVGLITVVHKYNAGTNELLDQLKAFVREMTEELGITGRLNPLGYPAPKQYFLDPDRLAFVYRDLAKFMLENGYRWSPFVDLWNAITGGKCGSGSVVCIFRPCDPFNTSSALVVKGNRMITNCQRHYPLVRDARRMTVREEILWKVPQEFGGCRGCKYFPICFGGCSANGINGDWRNRSFNCPAWRAILDYYDKVLRFMGIRPAYLDAKLPFDTSTRGGRRASHSDGIEHVDGSVRHLDSSLARTPKSSHADGIEHTDGAYKHLDSDPAHSDGFEHMDSGVRHLDSSCGSGHSDGIEHVDGAVRHLDSR